MNVKKHTPFIDLVNKLQNILPIILLFTISLFTSIKSQEQSEVFSRIGTEQGLAPGNVNDIIQDSLGFIWLGTESGLSRYDGYTFKLYKNELNNISSLSYNHVFSLLKAKNGIIWVGTLGGGLNKFNTKTGKFIRYQHNENNEYSISSDIVYKIYEDSKKRIWISTLGGGVNLFDPIHETFTRYTHDSSNPNSISSNMASAIFEDSNGKMWFGTFDGGMNSLDSSETKFIKYRHDPNNSYSINHDQVMDIIEYSPNYLLVATFGGGVNLLNTKSLEFRNYENDPDFKFKTDHRNVRKLFNDDNKIWIGTYNGLYMYNESNEKILKYFYDQNDPYSINNNKIREIFKDKNGVIWIGTTNGTNLYDPNRKQISFLSYDREYSKSLGNKFVVPSFADNSEIIWAGHIDKKNVTNKGIQRKIKYYGDTKITNKFKSKVSVNFYEDENNILWVGDYNGLKYYDQKERGFRYIEYFSSGTNDLGNNFVKSFYFDSKGQFWAGTLGGGLTHFDPVTSKTKRYIHLEEDEKSISDSRIIPIYEDNAKNLWIGTYGGLNKFNRESETFIRYTYKSNDLNSISNDRIYSIYESKKGDLWVGTYQGLNKYLRKENIFERITIEDGLSDNTIYGILEDDIGNLWIRTNKGISKYDPVKKTFKNYSGSDGLQGIESNGNIYFKNNDGKMFFGGLNGFNSFYPDMIHENTTPPDIVFTELTIMDQVIEIGDPNYLKKSLNEIEKLNLSYKDKAFSIEFAALHYSIPSKNKYAFMLEGFRDKWTYGDADNRIASFTNLGAGEYTLHIKGSNNDGIWNEIGRSLVIIITPPFWATWWFRLIGLLVFLGIIFLIYEYRLHRLLEVERTRARIARNLHDDVGGTLASIQYFVDAIRKNVDKQNMDKFLDLIMASSNDAQEKIRDIIWTVNPKEDVLSKFLVKFNRYASDLFDSHDIIYKIDFPKGELDKKIGMEKRQHLWCICKETVTNTIKHSKCKKVNISFRLIDNILHYTIEDDGVGFNKDTKVLGYGLTNIKFRAEKLAAKYNFDTSENNGMKLYISINI